MMSSVPDPYALAALPAFIVTMGASDFQHRLLSYSLFRLVRARAIPCADCWLSIVTACASSSSIRLSIPGAEMQALHCIAPTPLLPASVLKLSAFPTAVISELHTFTADFTRHHCTWPTFVPTHQARHYWRIS